MAKVRVIASTIRYGSNGFKHKGDTFNLPDAEAKDKAAKKLVEIVEETKAVEPKVKIKTEK
ncbi:hypothetical protein G7074_18165 [Pedobacter sp. HDW13]|uniref:hypothetical protein n=1 Tax=Pedobacter sp. HDW13 TaxID=2714940 RepID=UPI00140AA393|nr:hypothetical protein [Pedobacter sp. HDW13]QIL41020.1 hypothetical protein G7074_18165 [Pedobacter sp. HDW13]